MQTVRCAKKIKKLEQQGQTVGSLRELDELDKGVRSDRLREFAARHGLEEDIAKLKPDAQEQVFMQTVRCAKKIKELEQQGLTIGSLRELEELDKGVRAGRLREFAERHGLERDIAKLKPDAQEQLFMQTVRCAKKIKELEQQGLAVGSLR